MVNPRIAPLLAGLNGLLAVAAGAFGAHAAADPYVKALLQTGAQYQAVHAAAALACLAMARRNPALQLAAVLFGGGALLFAGSLYLLALTGAAPLGAVAPLGGGLLLAGWATVTVAAIRGRFD